MNGVWLEVETVSNERNKGQGNGIWPALNDITQKILLGLPKSKHANNLEELPESNYGTICVKKSISSLKSTKLADTRNIGQFLFACATALTDNYC